MENRLSPMRELLGELLLDAEQPAAALQVFKTSLKNMPNRYRSFAGAAKAAEALGDRGKAKRYYGSLVALGRGADTERPDLVKPRRHNRVRRWTKCRRSRFRPLSGTFRKASAAAPDAASHTR